MPDEKLEQEMKELTEKLRDRDEAERKKAVKEFRTAMGKDTAGTVLSMFQSIQAQIALQGQIIDATNPLAPVMRAISNIEARLTALEAAFVEIRKAKGGE